MHLGMDWPKSRVYNVYFWENKYTIRKWKIKEHTPGWISCTKTINLAYKKQEIMVYIIKGKVVTSCVHSHKVCVLR